MNGTLTTAPQKHAGSTFHRISLSKFFIQSEIQFGPQHPFSAEHGTAPLCGEQQCSVLSQSTVDQPQRDTPDKDSICN